MVHLLLAVIYVSFISLGLPDGLLGAAWPTMYPQFGVPVSYAGIISMIIPVGTIVSSLQSDRMTRRFGTGKVTALSVAMTAAALVGFSLSGSFWQLCLWAIPYGLGAGSVDASLNNYVALHYASRHMSWLHCMWGIGASTGPYVMGAVLAGGSPWNLGYGSIGFLQVVLSAVLLLSLPLWKRTVNEEEQKNNEPMGLLQVIKVPGAMEVMIMFFCYCAIEQTAGLWAASYLNIYKGVPAQTAASYASLFFLGMTAGRAVSGFVTLKLNDTQMIRLGMAIVGVGVCVMLLPMGRIFSVIGLAVIGLGCAPIYPCVIHSTPEHFGAEKSQAIIGVQMASAYLGTCLMPPLFGLVANHISAGLLPWYILLILIVMIVKHEQLIQKCKK